MSLTLAEELVLLAYDDETGKLAGASYLPQALAGAFLAELALLGRVRLADDVVTVADATPTGDPLLDEALWRLDAVDGRKPHVCLPVLADGSQRTVLNRLVERGLLREEQGKVLLVFRMTVYPTEDARPEQLVRQRLDDAVVKQQPTDERTVALAMLVHACALGRTMFPDLDAKQLKSRLDELADHWATTATANAIDSARATQAALLAVTSIMSTTLTVSSI